MPRGGKRPGAGKPKGSKSKLNQALGVVKDLIGDGQTPLEYLLEVMRNKRADVDLRIDAAKGAAPYVHKKKPQDVNMSGDLNLTHKRIILEDGSAPDGA